MDGRQALGVTMMVVLHFVLVILNLLGGDIFSIYLVP